jgi:hypothetical protein
VFAFLELPDQLSNREYAILFWALLCALALLVWAFRSAEWRQSLGELRALTAPKLLLLFVSTALHTAVVVFLANEAGLWHRTSLKEAIYWFVGTGLILVGNAAGVAGDPARFKRILRQALRLTIVVEFIVGLYVFPIVIELLLVPIAALLVCMSVVAEKDTKLAPARKLIKSAVVVGGLLLLAIGVARAIFDLDGLLTTDNASDLLVPPALTLALIPFAYLVAVVSAYEQLFIRISFFLREDKELARRSNRAIIGACRLNLRRISGFSNRFTPNLNANRNENDIAELISQFAAARATRRVP